MSVLCDGTADVYSETFPKARKEHTCCACAETIGVGQRYARVRIIGDGDVWSFKRCLRCQQIHEHLRDEVDSQDGEWPDEELKCGHEYSEVHGKPPPDDIAALAFALPGEVQDRRTTARAEGGGDG